MAPRRGRLQSVRYTRTSDGLGFRCFITGYAGIELSPASE